MKKNSFSLRSASFANALWWWIKICSIVRRNNKKKRSSFNYDRWQELRISMWDVHKRMMQPPRVVSRSNVWITTFFNFLHVKVMKRDTKNSLGVLLKISFIVFIEKSDHTSRVLSKLKMTWQLLSIHVDPE